MAADREIELDDACAGECGGHVAIRLLDHRRLGREAVVEPARLGGCIEQRRKLIDVELDQIGGVLGQILIGREHHSDRLADIAHPVLRQHVLAIRLELGQAGEAEADWRDRLSHPRTVHTA